MRTTQKNRFTYDVLEYRRLLAGNLDVLVSDSILLVVGDSANNQVEITQNESGSFVVTGVDTTINGGGDSFVANGGVQHITVAMHGGHDDVVVDGISVPSNFSFYGGAGNDRLVASGLAAGHFNGEGEQGDDIFEIDFQIRGSAYFQFGSGNDILSSKNMFVGRNLKVFGLEGDDTISTETMTVGRKLEFDLGSGADHVLMTGSTTVSKRVRVELGEGDDLFGLVPTQHSGNVDFRRTFSVDAGEGNDSLAFDLPQTLSRKFRIEGGGGSDSIQTTSNSGRARVGGVEAIESDVSSILDQVFARLEDAGIGVVEFEALSATAATTDLTLTENAAATSVDPNFVVTGSERVTRATIQISAFVPGDETLSFVDTGNITGNFDSTLGILTLTGRATVANYQAAIRSVQFRNTSDVPPTGSRQLDFTILNDEESVSVSRNIVIQAINDVPVVDPSITNLSVDPEDLPVVVDNLIALLDADDTNLTSATVSIVSGYQANEDILSVQDSSGITSSFDATTGVLTLIGDATVSQWQTLLRSLTYSNQNTTTTEGVRTIEYSVSDGQGNGTTQVRLILQAEAVPNNFVVSESTVNGTVLGQVTTQGTFDAGAVFQFANGEIPETYLLNADDHLSGNLTAPVVMIEYLDFECPNCASFHPVVNQLESDFEGDLLVVRRHLPLESIHPNARVAARAAEAAGQQGMFDEMADLLFANRNDWVSEADPTSLFEQYATSLGLNLEQYRLAEASAEVDARVSRDANEAAQLGIQSTASFILQGERISNPSGQTAFTNVIDDAVVAVNNPFSINRRTGEVIVYDSSLIGLINTPSVDLDVLVTGSDGITETVAITFDITDQV